MTGARSGWSPTIDRRSSAAPGAVELDLAVDLGAVENRAVHDVRVVVPQLVPDGGQVGVRAAEPDQGVRHRPAVEGAELGRDRGPGRAEGRLVDDAVEVEPLGEAGGADVHAEALVDVRGRSERELRAAAARVEDRERAAGDGKRRGGRHVGEPGLLLPGDDLDLDACPLTDGLDERRAVRCHAHAGGSDRRDRHDAELRSPRRPCPRSRRPCARSAPCRARRCRRGPRRAASRRRGRRPSSSVPSAARSPTWNLTEFVPTSRTAYRAAPKPASAFSPRGTLTFSRPASPSSASAAWTQCGILGLDRDRRARALGGRELAQLRHRAGDRVVPAHLVHVDRPQVGVRLDQLAAELVERVLASLEPRSLDARAPTTPRPRPPAASGNSAFITGRHCSSPP